MSKFQVTFARNSLEMNKKRHELRLYVNCVINRPIKCNYTVFLSLPGFEQERKELIKCHSIFIVVPFSPEKQQKPIIIKGMTGTI